MWSIETDTPEHAEFFRAYFAAHPEELRLVRKVTDPVTGEWDIQLPPTVLLSFLESVLPGKPGSLSLAPVPAVYRSTRLDLATVMWPSPVHDRYGPQP